MKYSFAAGEQRWLGAYQPTVSWCLPKHLEPQLLFQRYGFAILLICKDFDNKQKQVCHEFSSLRVVSELKQHLERYHVTAMDISFPSSQTT